MNLFEFIEDIKFKWEDLQIWWQEEKYKTSPERILYAKQRMAVHRLNIAGKCPINPYLDPDGDWYDYIPPELQEL